MAAIPTPCPGPGGASEVGAAASVPSPAAAGPGTKPTLSRVFLKAAPSLGMGQLPKDSTVGPVVVAVTYHKGIIFFFFFSV